MGNPRELLLAERARALRRVAALEREFADLAEAASAGGTDDEHDPEGATLAFERQHTAGLLQQAREQVAAVDAALGQLAAGRYGLCERCGQPIGDGRLAARPAALTCVRCAARQRSLPGGPGLRRRAGRPGRLVWRGALPADRGTHPRSVRLKFFHLFQSVRAW